MLDRDGYRPNVGIILVNQVNEVFWGKRIREHAWQFPQGGIKRGETPEEAMFRELEEEIGLRPEHVRIIGRTRDWLHYDVPAHWVRRDWRGFYRGQKQIWFLLRMLGQDSDVRLQACEHPEFDAWRWHAYWVPLEAVIEFKRAVYRAALLELANLLDGLVGPTSQASIGTGSSGTGSSGMASAGTGSSGMGAAATQVGPSTDPASSGGPWNRAQENTMPGRGPRGARARRRLLPNLPMEIPPDGEMALPLRPEGKFT